MPGKARAAAAAANGGKAKPVTKFQSPAWKGEGCGPVASKAQTAGTLLGFSPLPGKARAAASHETFEGRNALGRFQSPAWKGEGCGHYHACGPQNQHASFSPLPGKARAAAKAAMDDNPGWYDLVSVPCLERRGLRHGTWSRHCAQGQAGFSPLPGKARAAAAQAASL